MYRGTTPTVYVHSNIDLSEWDVEMAIKCRNITLIKDGSDITVRQEEDGSCWIYTTLTQEETLSFPTGAQAAVQLRAIKDGSAIASTIGEVPVEKILRDGTMPYVEPEPEPEPEEQTEGE